MTRVKKLALATLTALALAVGAVAVSPAAEMAKASPKLFLNSDATSPEVADDADRSGIATPILF